MYAWKTKRRLRWVNRREFAAHLSRLRTVSGHSLLYLDGINYRYRREKLISQTQQREMQLTTRNKWLTVDRQTVTRDFDAWRKTNAPALSGVVCNRLLIVFFL